MGLTQRQLLAQQQKLSPQQIQTMRLLELPVVQLEQRIKEELEENVMLEEAEKPTADEEQQPQQTSLDEYLREENVPFYKNRSDNYTKDARPYPVALAKSHSLQEYLNEQLGFRNLSQKDRAIARYLVGSLDEAGYLRRDLSSISDDIAFTTGTEVETSELERILKIIQSLEPAGIGARDLRECLLLQLARQPLDTPARELANRILTERFDDFIRKHYAKLLAQLQVSEAQFRAAVEVITALTPRPANAYSEDADVPTAPAIIPDFLLDYRDGRFSLSLNSYNEPALRLNTRYRKMLREMVGADGKVPAEDKETFAFIKGKLDAAQGFIDAVAQRRATLMHVMQAILDYQQEYFKAGDVAKLRPMILKNIAERAGVDISTVSRVVNSKYIQTRFGIIHLRSLFSEGMATDSGGEVSSREIKQILRDTVDKEDKQHPLTDEELLAVLRERGYRIARRTIAKYREQSGIPVARMRKEL